MNESRITEARIARYEIPLRIAAPRDRVWTALVAETDRWWPEAFRMLGPGSRVALEAAAGGRLIETREDGAGLLWYTVHACEPGRRLDLLGHSWPAWGGPATSMLTLALEDEDEGCVLTIADAVVGRVDARLVENLTAGWTEVFDGALRPHCEA